MAKPNVAKSPDVTPPAGPELNGARRSFGIPKPRGHNEKGEPEYQGDQLVKLLHPDWPAESLLSNHANAHRAKEHIGGEVCFNPGLGCRVYKGGLWAEDDKRDTLTAGKVVSVGPLVRKEAAQLLEYAAELQRNGRDADARAMTRAALQLQRHTARVESKSFVDDTTSLLKPLIFVEIERFDPRRGVFGFQNVTFDKGDIREHRKEDYLTHLSPVCYNETVDQSEWLTLLERITKGDLDYALMLQQVCGYAFSGASDQRIIPYFCGPKGTGKSTIQDLIQTAMGSSAVTVDPRKFQDCALRGRLGADIHNRRAVFLSEAGSQKMEAELLKTLSGSDRITVQPMYRDAFTALPKHVLIMVANDPPLTDAYDAALRERILVLPFSNSLDDGPPLSFTGGERVETVRKIPESPLVLGFTAWAIAGLSQFLRSGKLHIAKCSVVATRVFWAKADPISGFWDLLEEEGHPPEVSKKDLRDRYEAWCNSESVTPLGTKTWARACEARGLQGIRKTAGAHFWQFPRVTGVTQPSLFSRNPCENENEHRVVLEKTPFPVTPVTNSDADTVDIP